MPSILMMLTQLLRLTVAVSLLSSVATHFYLIRSNCFLTFTYHSLHHFPSFEPGQNNTGDLKMKHESLKKGIWDFPLFHGTYGLQGVTFLFALVAQ